ncbi:hypothetical protein DQ244_14430 [Blastococcus sp. TBT05-19]|nr:hypothetical protein DQ244_14430 [Blastococcus sp. TBT05-19]
MALLAGVGASIGVLPGVLFLLSVPLTLGYTALVVLHVPLFAVVFVVLPCLLGLGAVRLLSRRDRWVLVLGGSVVTAYVGWLAYRGLVHGEATWPVLVLAGPALAPLAAMAPSVRRWLTEEQVPS